MSHEGVRIVSEEAARRAAFDQRDLPPEAIQPQHVRVNLTEGTGVEIDWKDGHKSVWTFKWLRDACPCAMCMEQRESTGRKAGKPVPEPKTALPMYKPAIRPGKVEPVGRYAIRFNWNDNHTSGIYSWHYLRSICQCPYCLAANAAE